VAAKFGTTTQQGQVKSSQVAFNAM